MFACAPFGAAYWGPKFQAHLSAFSRPRVSYHAFRSGSVTDSSSSWAMTLAMPSAPVSPLGLTAVCASHAPGQRSGLPTNEYLMSAPAIVPWVCQPQYAVQNPDDSSTSADVSTKYTPF